MTQQIAVWNGRMRSLDCLPRTKAKKFPRLIRAVLQVALLITAAMLQNACVESPDRTTPVGRTFVAFVDDERQSWIGAEKRPLHTTVWYPAISGVQETQWTVGIFQAGWSAKDAAMVDLPRKLPLVVLSHGTGGASAQVSWLAEHLASNGYLVAAVNHHGNTAAEDQYAPQGFILWWERARDLSVVIDKVIADPRFGQRVDSNRIVAGGFSLGGYSVLALAGARTNFAEWRDYCERTPDDTGCTTPPEAQFSLDDLNRLAVEDDRTKDSLASAGHSYRDRRVKAVYAIAPVLRAAFDTDSLEKISIPVRLTVGSDDRQAVPELNAYPLKVAIPRASLRELPQVGHYTFLAPCNIQGKLLVSQLCVDESGIDREEVHQQVATDALNFFARVLDT